jgi:hypothetical protein
VHRNLAEYAVLIFAAIPNVTLSKRFSLSSINIYDYKGFPRPPVHVPVRFRIPQKSTMTNYAELRHDYRFINAVYIVVRRSQHKLRKTFEVYCHS